MDYNDVLENLAPCGVDCVRCADYSNGEIKRLSLELIKLLGSYERIAKLKEETIPSFKDYSNFEDILKYFSTASCSGCRGENVQCFISCSAKKCHKEKGLDFCFQCNDYPCEENFTGSLGERFKKLCDRMKEIGVVEFYKERVKLPRY